MITPFRIGNAPATPLTRHQNQAEQKRNDRMQVPTQIHKPANWQDFETLCMKLWGRIWDCADTIKKNGRAGQKQYGVDILGKKKGENLFSAIQCKGKDDYTNSKLTTKEIDTEIENARHYDGKLIRFIIATTANKDAEIEEYVMGKNIEHCSKGLFEVYLFSWEDIVDRLTEHKDVYQWYLGLSNFIGSHNINVTFEDGSIEYTIYPHYCEKTKKYVLPDDKQYIMYKQVEQRMKELADQLYPPKLQSIGQPSQKKTNKSWCRIPICIKNSGTVEVELVKMDIDCKKEYVLTINSKIPSELDGFMSSWGALPPELSRRNDTSCGLRYEPRERLIVPQDEKKITFYIMPCPNTDQLDINFKLYTREYFSEKSLHIVVKPEYHKASEYIVVDSNIDKKPDSTEYSFYFE